MPKAKYHKRQMHGLSHLPEYNHWQMMRNRCLNPNSEEYSRYGGRGIQICSRWVVGTGSKHPFICFLEDMGTEPSKNHELDRWPDNDGNYEPGNVRWATPQEQGWSKVGKSRPDLVAYNKSRAGIQLSPEHKKNISDAQTGKKKAPYKNKGRPIDSKVVANRIGKKRGPYLQKGK